MTAGGVLQGQGMMRFVFRWFIRSFMNSSILSRYGEYPGQTRRSAPTVNGELYTGSYGLRGSKEEGRYSDRGFCVGTRRAFILRAGAPHGKKWIPALETVSQLQNVHFLSFRPEGEILYLLGVSTTRFLGYHLEMTL